MPGAAWAYQFLGRNMQTQVGQTTSGHVQPALGVNWSKFLFTWIGIKFTFSPFN